MNTHSKTPVEKAGAIRIPLSQIVVNHGMRVRDGDRSEHHIHTLRQALQRGSKFPPVLVWAETDEQGAATGRLVLLDGHHRIIALKAEKPDAKDVLAEVIQGTCAQAILAAAGRNTRASIPLTRRQATNAAWRIVRADNDTISKTQIARACGVSTSTVGNMRRTWKAWPEGRDVSGNWYRDARPEQDDEQGAKAMMSEIERKQAIKKTAKAMQAIISPYFRQDDDFLADVLTATFGPYRMCGIVDYYRGGEDDMYAPQTEAAYAPRTELEGDETPRWSAEDPEDVAF